MKVMSHELELAMKYGGFTSLDKVYLEGVLAGLSQEDKMRFITPPPSVINAYFAEIYQKQGPQAATAYFWEISQALQLWQENPSFAEEKPFVRLNLGGQAFGLAYVSDQKEVAQVFAQEVCQLTPDLLWDMAQLFPHYQVYEEEGKVFLADVVGQVDFQLLAQERYLLTEVANSPDWIKIAGLNREEVLEVAEAYSGASYYAWEGRQALLYRKK